MRLGGKGQEAEFRLSCPRVQFCHGVLKHRGGEASMPRHMYQELNARLSHAKVANCLSSTLTHKQIQFCLESDL